MVLPLVSRGVVSGICLVFAKYWYDRRIEKQEQPASHESRAESASIRAISAPASTAAIDVQATRPVASIDPEAHPDDRGEPTSKDFEAGDVHPAVAETVSDDAADSIGPAWQTPATGSLAEPRQKTTRGKKDDDQRVEEALAFGDLSSMETLLDDISDPVLRNRLLKRLVNGYYRRRSDAMHRAAFYRVALLQMEEASSILEGIEEIGEPRPDFLEAFKTMAIALDEDGSLEGAIAVCEMALSLGLQDGTKTGYEGRIRRLKRQRLSADTASLGETIH